MKNHKILKIIGIIFLVLLIIFIIHTVRNYIIINKIFAKESELIDKTNYSFDRMSYNENSPDNIINSNKVYHKDSKSTIAINENNITIIIWNDIETQEQITMIPQTLVAYKDHLLGSPSIPMLFGSKEVNTFGFKLLLAMTSIITDEKVNNESTYCVRLNYLTTFINSKIWVNKDTGIVMKTTVGFDEIDGKSYPRISEITNFSFDSVTDEDVSKPNLTGYKITEWTN